MVGTPVFIRLLPRGGGEPVIDFGTERPSGSGHYVAESWSRRAGSAIVEIGLRGEMCEAGVCTTSDILFHLNGETLVAGDVAGAVTGVRRRARPRSVLRGGHAGSAVVAAGGDRGSSPDRRIAHGRRDRPCRVAAIVGIAAGALAVGGRSGGRRSAPRDRLDRRPDGTARTDGGRRGPRPRLAPSAGSDRAGLRSRPRGSGR